MKKKGGSLMGSIIGFVSFVVAIYFVIKFLRFVVMGWLIGIEWIWKKMKENHQFAYMVLSVVVIIIFSQIGRIYGR